MRRRANCGERANSEIVGVSARLNSHQRWDTRVSILAIEQALDEARMHAALRDLARRAQSIERAIMQSRLGRKREHLC